MLTTEQHFTHLVENISTVNTTNKIVYDSAVLQCCRTALVIYMTLVAILAVSGNGIISLVERNNKCKTSTDWLVSFMAANDLIYAIINIPIHISLQLGSWTFSGSDALCKGHKFVERVTMYSSALLLCIVALDRYWKTCRPYKKFLTPERALKVCVCETFISCVVTSPVPVITVYDGTSRCIAIEMDNAITKTVTGIVSVTYVVMFIIVVVCYTKVAFTIRRKLIRTNDAVARCEKENINGKASTSHPIENNGSPKMSLATSMYGRKNKVHPLVDLKCAAKELKDVQASVKRPKGGVFENNESNPHVTHVVCKGQCQKQQKFDTRPRLRIKGSLLLDSRINRTTKIMFAVTLVFLASWIPTWSVVLYNQHDQLHEVDKTLEWKISAAFGEKSFMLNTFTNPVFYIWLSSVFKEKAKRLVKNLFICCNGDRRNQR